MKVPRLQICIIWLVLLGCNSQNKIEKQPDRPATEVGSTETRKADESEKQSLVVQPSSVFFGDELRRTLESKSIPENGTRLRSEVDQVTEVLLQSFPDVPDVLEIRARFQFLVGDSDAAEATWTQAIKIDPDYGYAHHGLGKVAKLNGNLKPAIQHFQTALRSQPNNTDLIHDLANALTADGNSAEVCTLLESFVEQKSPNAETYVLLGNAYLAESKFEQAREAFSTALKLYPELPRAQQGLGMALVRLGDRERAKELLKAQATARSVQDRNRDADETFRDEVIASAQIYFQVASILAFQAKSSEAELVAQRATIFDPQELGAWRLLIGLREAGGPDRVLQTCRSMVESNPTDPSVHYEMGTLESAFGNFEAAESAFNQVLEMTPNDPAGYRGLIELSLKRQSKTDLNRAILLSQQLLNMDSSAVNFDLLAQAHAANQNWDQAWAAIEKALEADPDNPQYKFARSQLERIRGTGK